MTRKELVALAVRAALRYQTSMAAAFRRCLGVAGECPGGSRRQSRLGAVEPDLDADLAECFANEASPMDVAL